MEENSKRADGRRRWRHWTEEQAQAALGELAQSGERRESRRDQGRFRSTSGVLEGAAARRAAHAVRCRRGVDGDQVGRAAHRDRGRRRRATHPRGARCRQARRPGRRPLPTTASMRTLPPGVRVFVATGRVDGRKGCTAPRSARLIVSGLSREARVRAEGSAEPLHDAVAGAGLDAERRRGARRGCISEVGRRLSSSSTLGVPVPIPVHVRGGGNRERPNDRRPVVRRRTQRGGPGRPRGAHCARAGVPEARRVRGEYGPA